jgi:hypothetical protein
MHRTPIDHRQGELPITLWRAYQLGSAMTITPANGLTTSPPEQVAGRSVRIPARLTAAYGSVGTTIAPAMMSCL